ncbi:hypothetical protein C6A87_022530 [Mycobacterium sp. ITM-2016-00317]|uniref:hypothetical protein n=1 Tax=Mycobacterium sp. ITM-2016-00317 TaxID=2099694 RepID=UPI00287F8950|nr:hypothetical protein [Mycobacterium sp. ITM-2016-00317]WNG86580.1 hypothetical protein C6A87_022530 [Mycobacterium sp. ITM-2016-00317]
MFSSRTRRRAVAAAVVLAATLVPSCTRVVDDARAVAVEPGTPFGSYASADACTSVNGKLADIAPPRGSAADTEPVLRIPQPDGWKRITALDSPMIRFVMRNDGLAKGGIAPTAVVTLESHRGEIAAKKFFADQQRQVKQLGVTDLTLTDTTVCGLPAVRGHYLSSLLPGLKPRRADLLSAVMFSEGRTYGVAVTVQSADEQDPEYRRDVDQILGGFQMLPPGSR